MASASRWPGKYLDELPGPGLGPVRGQRDGRGGRCGRRWTRRPHYKLANLIAIVDVNRLGQRGPTDLGWDTGAYRRRAEAFGARMFVIDGHDVAAIDEALAQAGDLTGDQPAVILARTIKGKGFSEVEDAEQLARQAVPAGHGGTGRGRARRRAAPGGPGTPASFCSSWTNGPRPTAARAQRAPTRFVGCDAYGVQLLRHDIARFTLLLGESDGEGLFSPTHPPPVRSLAEAVVVGPKCNRAGAEPARRGQLERGRRTATGGSRRPTGGRPGGAVASDPGLDSSAASLTKLGTTKSQISSTSRASIP